jgi:hypothetical protein
VAYGKVASHLFSTGCDFFFCVLRFWHGPCISFFLFRKPSGLGRDATKYAGEPVQVGPALGSRRRRCEMMVVAVGFNAEVLNSPSDETLTAAGISARGGRLTRALDCLIVSGEASRRQRFSAAAELAGWDECSSPEDLSELRDAAERDFSLAIIDITSPVGDVVNETVELAEELAARPNTLVVICGSEDNVDEELWARQLGAWLYLPGVTDGDSLTSLCVEARRLREGPVGFSFR